jgi:glycosyltransferase involved in cell wall biosynthesis
MAKAAKVLTGPIAQAGPSTMLVLTDGKDNRALEDKGLNPQKLSIPALLGKTFAGSNIKINVIAFQAGEEENQVKEDFEGLPKMEPPGSFISAYDLDTLINQMERSLRREFLYQVEDNQNFFLTGMPADGFAASQVGFSAMTDPGFAAPTAERPPVPFRSGDVYVSMGLDWEQKDLVYLYEQKRILGFKVVLFCYDVIPVKFPHLCVGDVAAKFARYFADLAWCADQVLCISECSRNDFKALLGELGAPLPNMSVIKLGCQLPVIATDVIASDVAALLGQRFVLFVSTIERRKNHETLYRAYTRLIDAGETNLPLLVFVGMPGWGVNDLMADLRFDPRTKDLIKLLHHVNDTDLARLYQHALMTVFPSLYEGWGLPVAESLAAGKCCLASGVASIPEVGGDLVDYVDPWDVPAWAERLRWYFNNPSLVANKEARIKDSYQPMSWPKCAEDVFGHATGLMTRPTQQATSR